MRKCCDPHLRWERAQHVTLGPLDRDAIQAMFRDGFLVITLPKLQAPPQPTTTSIPVSGS